MKNKVREFAINKHSLPSDCQRYGNVPYDEHLKAVVSVFEEYKYYIDEKYHYDIESACWCHDLIEDTDTNLKWELYTCLT